MYTLPFALPFRVSTSPDLTLRDSVDLTFSVQFREQVDDSWLEDMDTALNMVSMFTSAGVFQTADSQAELVGLDFVPYDQTETQVDWKVAALDDRNCISTGWLTALFSHLSLVYPNCLTAIRQVNISSSTSAELKEMTIDPDLSHPYLALPQALPFFWESEEEYGDSLECIVVSDDELSEEKKDKIQTKTGIWHMGILSGLMAFPFEVEDGSGAGMQILADQYPELEDDELHWELQRLRFHPDAINALVQVFVYIHKHIAPITSVAFE